MNSKEAIAEAKKLLPLYVAQDEVPRNDGYTSLDDIFSHIGGGYRRSNYISHRF